MNFLLDIITHTPLWVWGGLALLVFMGLKQTLPRDVSALRMWLVPIIMGAYSFYGSWSSFGGVGQAFAATAWIVGAAIGFAANGKLDLPRQVAVNADGSFRIGGSLAPLVLFVSIFMLRYAIGVTLAVAPALAHDLPFALAASLAGGVPTGLLLARSRKVLSTRRPDAGLVRA